MFNTHRTDFTEEIVNVIGRNMEPLPHHEWSDNRVYFSQKEVDALLSGEKSTPDQRN